MLSCSVFIYPILLDLLKFCAIFLLEMNTEPTFLSMFIDFIIGSLIVIIGMGISLFVLAFFNGLFDFEGKSPKTDVFVPPSN